MSCCDFDIVNPGIKVDKIYCWCSSWKAILSSLNQVNSLQSDSFNSVSRSREQTFLLQFAQEDPRNIFFPLTRVRTVYNEYLDRGTKWMFLLTFRLENLRNRLESLHTSLTWTNWQGQKKSLCWTWIIENRYYYSVDNLGFLSEFDDSSW